jgi:hypothetical protein
MEQFTVGDWVSQLDAIDGDDYKRTDRFARDGRHQCR